MSYQINFADNGKGLIFKRSAGAAVNTSDFEKAIVRFFQEHKSALAAIRYVYLDYTEADKLKLAMEDILRFVEIAKIIAMENNQLVVAICAPDFDNYCITKKWEVHLPDEFGWETMAFRDQEETLEWLRKLVQPDLTFT
ncbi:MAG: hypothetical protein PHY09_01515 [Desulfuromonadaceae bacterium]|nr:hypothetical protein [Desulfuromonadaceae bacterium]